MNRREFLKLTSVTIGSAAAASTREPIDQEPTGPFPLIDLHVHTTKAFSIDHIMDISRKSGVQFGIVEHPAPWAIKDDNDLKAYIEKLESYPVYIGLQPIDLGWSKDFSPELLSRIDYILMDAQRVPMKNGERLSIWEFDTYVDDTNEFMDRYMDYTMQILENEPLSVFAWPLFLPVCIARDYYELWTEERMSKIIAAASKRNIAIEINDMAHTPHREFIHMARKAGLKFTFGSDARNNIAGRLAYCKRVAQACDLTEQDIYVPKSDRLLQSWNNKPGGSH